MVSSSVPQATAIADRLPQLPTKGANDPQVLIPSALKLTREQEDRLIQHCLTRKETLVSELGRTDFESEDWHEQMLDEEGQFQRRHLASRHMALMAYKMKYEWREAIYDGIFRDSNLHIPFTRRILQQVIARMINYFVGTTPYFSADPEGIEDEELAEKINRWLQHELQDIADTRSIVSAIIERALVCGEALLALSYHSTVSFYQTEKEILVGPDQQPIVGSDNDYIIKGQDRWVTQKIPITNPDGTPAIGPDGMPLYKEGPQVLERDGTTPFPPAGEVYRAEIIWRKSTIKESPKADLLSPFDILYPLNCESLDKADCIVHFYDETLIQLVHRLQMVADLPPKEMIAYLAEITQRLLAVSKTQPMAEANKARRSNSESTDSLGLDRNEPMINWTRYCVFFDALNDGNIADIIIIMTEDGSVPLYYDYVQNFTPDHRRPYRMVTVNKDSERCCGQGLVEIFEHLQKAADLIFNRWNFSLSRSGNIIWWHPENTVEGEENPDLPINGGETLRLKPGKTTEETLKVTPIHDIKNVPLREMLDFVGQMIMNMSGISNVNDGQAVGLDSTKLATGVRNLEKSGQELTDKIVSDLNPGLTDLIKSLSALSCANLREQKKFRYFNGDIGVLAKVTPEEVMNLAMDITMHLTKYRGEQRAAENTSAMNAGIQFYSLPPEAQQMLAGVFQDLMKDYGVKDPPGPMMPAPLPATPPAPTV